MTDEVIGNWVLNISFCPLISPKWGSSHQILHFWTIIFWQGEDFPTAKNLRGSCLPCPHPRPWRRWEHWLMEHDIAGCWWAVECWPADASLHADFHPSASVTQEVLRTQWHLPLPGWGLSWHCYGQWAWCSWWVLN